MNTKVLMNNAREADKKSQLASAQQIEGFVFTCNVLAFCHIALHRVFFKE